MPDQAQLGLCAQVSRTGDTVTISLAGELDSATLDAARQTIRDAGSGPVQVVFDLQDVTFCDCAGVHLLLAARKSIIAAGGTVALRSANPVVRRVLELTRTLPSLCPEDPSLL